jgi:protein-S-isoprenylcysteine O-methyltransferase Ste14
MKLKVLSILGYIIAVIALVILVFRSSFLGEGYIAVAVQVLAALLMIWSRITFGSRSFHASADPTEGGLVTSGPYHYLRHPIYASIIYFFWAGIFSHLEIWNAILGFIATGGLFLRIFLEEKLVVKKYPEYSGYAAKTKRIIPFIF